MGGGVVCVCVWGGGGGGGGGTSAWMPQPAWRDACRANGSLLAGCYLQVCDFNLSEILKHQPAATPMGDEATNPTWLAPEVLSGERASAASDVYGFGCVLWELLVWRLPWARQPPYQVRKAVLEGKRPEIPERAALPGPDNDKFMQLDAYCQLIRCASSGR